MTSGEGAMTDRDGGERRLDRLVAEHVMGWRNGHWREDGLWYWPSPHSAVIELPRYASDWSEMRQVVQAMRERWRDGNASGAGFRHWEFHEYGDGWGAAICDAGTCETLFEAWCSDLPEAVAKAALLACDTPHAKIDEGTDGG